MILQNQAVPILAFTNHQPEPGMQPHRGVVLARYHRQFVTWDCYRADEDEEWHCESGHYFANDLDLAKYSFGMRVAHAIETITEEAAKRGLMSGLKVMPM